MEHLLLWKFLLKIINLNIQNSKNIYFILLLLLEIIENIRGLLKVGELTLRQNDVHIIKAII